jgi:hypothetical protein
MKLVKLLVMRVMTEYIVVAVRRSISLGVCGDWSIFVYNSGA